MTTLDRILPDIHAEESLASAETFAAALRLAYEYRPDDYPVDASRQLRHLIFGAEAREACARARLYS